jgi:hypothetical protein
LLRGIIATIVLVWIHVNCLNAQDANSTPPNPAFATELMVTSGSTSGAARSKQETIALAVQAGTPLQVALDSEVRIRGVGQNLRGHIVEPVYAFDKLVIPVGSKIIGEISNIESISKRKRTMAALDADFTPAHSIEIKFNELILPDDKHVPIRTVVTPGSGKVIRFLTASDKKEKNAVKDAAMEKAKQAKLQAKQEWNAAMQLVRQPGKIHAMQRYVLALLPVHPHYLEAGTMYFAELQQSLDFGSEPMTQEMSDSLGSAPPPGSFVRARLNSSLSSATTQKGAEVEATLSQPLFNGSHLILPQDTRLKGAVIQVRPARHMKRNGQLRMTFRELIPPAGPGAGVMAERIETTLEGVQAAVGDNLKLDVEGGTEASSPKSRYALTAVSVGLAAVSAGVGGDTLGDTAERSAGGAGGFKLIGIVVGAAVHSQTFGIAMGAFGASKSVYSHFIARGRDVVFPKNTALLVGISSRPAATSKPSSNRQR